MLWKRHLKLLWKSWCAFSWLCMCFSDRKLPSFLRLYFNNSTNMFLYWIFFSWCSRQRFADISSSRSITMTKFQLAFPFWSIIRYQAGHLKILPTKKTAEPIVIGKTGKPSVWRESYRVSVCDSLHHCSVLCTDALWCWISFIKMRKSVFQCRRRRWHVYILQLYKKEEKNEGITETDNIHPVEPEEETE